LKIKDNYDRLREIKILVNRKRNILLGIKMYLKIMFLKESPKKLIKLSLPNYSIKKLNTIFHLIIVTTT
jgi:hypothetical protein